MTDKNNSKNYDEKKEVLLNLLKGKISTASNYFKDKENQKSPLEQIKDLFTDSEIVKSTDGIILKRTVKIDLNNPSNERGYRIEISPNDLDFNNVSLEKIAGKEFSGFKFKDFLFFDIETTGLAGGTGTYPFLIGLGYFEDSIFILEQYFMPDYPDEYAQMNQLKKKVTNFKGLITYNGKTFDIPVMRSRFIYHRIKTVWEIPNWDLLHVSRKLWKQRFKDCSLGNIEREILKLEREHDIDGSLIPYIYFDFLRGIRIDRMQPVFDHNAQDIISLAVLAVKFLKFITNPDMNEISHASEQLGLHKINLNAGEIEDSVLCLERALYFCKDDDLSKKILLTLAQFYKKINKWEKALEIWIEQTSKNPSVENFEAFIESAKYYEHIKKDYDSALDIIVKAEKVCELSAQIGYISVVNNNYENKIESYKSDFRKRKERINRKKINKDKSN